MSEGLGKSISKKVLIKFLKSIGYTYRRIRKVLKKTPDKVEYEQKSLELAQLLKLEEKKFIKVYFSDESGFNETPNVPYGWQHKDAPLGMPSQRGQRLNVFGLMTRENELISATTTKTIDSQFVIAQIDHLAQDVSRNCDVIVVMDNAKIHHSEPFNAKIPQWLDQGVRIFYLPTYSPHLNFIETLWRKMKHEWLCPKHYVDWTTLKNQIHHILEQFGSQYTIKFA